MVAERDRAAQVRGGRAGDDRERDLRADPAHGEQMHEQLALGGVGEAVQLQRVLAHVEVRLDRDLGAALRRAQHRRRRGHEVADAVDVEQQPVRRVRPRACRATARSRRHPASGGISAWQMATASASASCEVAGLLVEREEHLTIRCTWPLSARPWPQTDCFTRAGAYSAHSMPAVAAATSAAPRACPTESAMRASAPTKDSSSATASGACAAMSSWTPSKIVRSRSSGRSRAPVVQHPDASGPDPPVAFVDDPVPARSRPWVDAENLHDGRVSASADGLGAQSP